MTSGWSATLPLPDYGRISQRREHGIDDVAGDCGDFIAIVNVPLLGAIPSAPRILVQF
jgi:hypothetical protein